jgi:16S rRNA (guanine966-N2)-methyltransferase
MFGRNLPWVSFSGNGGVANGNLPGLTACETETKRAVSGHGPEEKQACNEESRAMRISGGAARGVTLDVPKGDAVRPATDGLRQAVFSSLAMRVPGATFLDLFAGSGAYGLEALSRGAAGGTFVEKNAKTAACLRRNIAAVCKSLRRDEAGLKVLNGDVLEWTLGAVETVPDLVFVDPPYEMIVDVGPKIFERLGKMLRSEMDPIVVFEMPGEITLSPAGWTAVKRLGGGVRQPTATFFRTSPAST